MIPQHMPKLSHWDSRFINLSQHVAQWSRDPSTKVGAVIVDHHHRVVGLGYNGFPRGVDDRDERYQDKATKYKLVVHSEANAILNAVVPVQGFSIYVTKFPCSECTKLIIQSGISRIYSPTPSTDEPWATDANFSKLMLKEAVVHHREILL